jgi:hypothetical protein
MDRQVAVAVNARQEVNVDADLEFYEAMVQAGMSESDAARATDYRIARRAAERKLARQGLHRGPTEAEVDRILASM